MHTSLYIALGGGAGSVCRYWLSTSVYLWLGRAFPFGTLAVNVLGSLMAGLLVMVLTTKMVNLSTELRNLLLVGFLGGFTTFSAFSIETFALLEAGDISRALGNIVLSVGLCLLAVWLGTILGRQL